MIDVVNDKDKGFASMEHLLAASPYPIFKVRKDATIVYANEAASHLLKIWGINKGEKLPSNIIVFVKKAILEKGACDIEIKEKGYSLTFKSSESRYVYIYGLDLVSLKLKEKKTLPQEKYKEILSGSRQSLSSADFKKLIDQTAEMVASTIKVESCSIFKIYHKSADFPAAPLQHSGTATDVQRVFDVISIKELGSFGQTCTSGECTGGISAFLRSQGKTCLAITLQKSRYVEFTPEEVRFLRYVLSLILKVKECKDIGTKLQDRTLFLGRLLQKVPDPAYFKDVSQTFQSQNELFTAKTPSKREREEKSIHELEEMIPTELKAIYKVKNKELPGKVGGFPLIMPDICMFRESEETLKMALEVQKVLWTVVNNSPAVVFLWRNEDNWPADFVTENVFQLGYTAEDFTSNEILYGNIIHREDIDRVQEEREHQIKKGSETFESEYRIYTKDGTLCWVDERTFIQRNKAGKVTHFQGVVIDITERKAAEEAFEKAEQVKKKEINHRIKNNLQIVSFLLDLQAEKFSDRRVIEAFKESENRILSMSLIHQELYESGKLDSLDFSSYLRKLITDLIRSYRTENCNIQVNLDVNSFFLEVDTAVSLGIIINELFTNSFKYAFPVGTNGEINISLIEDRNGEEDKNENSVSSYVYSPMSPDLTGSPDNSGNCKHFTLVFEDNGKGFPEDIDFRSSTSLGLQLVNALVDQIGGSIELERNRGTKFSIKFTG